MAAASEVSEGNDLGEQQLQVGETQKRKPAVLSSGQLRGLRQAGAARTVRLPGKAGDQSSSDGGRCRRPFGQFEPLMALILGTHGDVGDAIDHLTVITAPGAVASMFGGVLARARAPILCSGLNT